MLREIEVPIGGTFDGLSRQQTLIYARELGEHFETAHHLRHVLTEREQHIREMAAAFTRAQEEERQWIAYELHDRVAQTLACVFQQLQILESMAQRKSDIRQVAERASLLLREAIRESRNIMNDLHPPVLDEFGIVPLIEEELRQFRDETGCRTKLKLSNQIRPPKDVEVALYRIFHEALINVRRHASTATNVTVDLTCGEHSVALRVQDDGPGFDVEAALEGKRAWGLMSMRRRAEILGGTFQVASGPDQGTKVSIAVCTGSGNEKWLRKSEQGDKWNRCLIEGMIVLSETGARDEQTTPP